MDQIDGEWLIQTTIWFIWLLWLYIYVKLEVPTPQLGICQKLPWNQKWIARQSSNFVLSNNWTSKRRGFGTCLVPIFGLNISSHGFQILFSELSTTSGTHTAIHELGQAINQGVGLCFALSHGYLQKFLLLPGNLSKTTTHYWIVSQKIKLLSSRGIFFSSGIGMH